MLLPQLIVVALAPAFVSAALFPKGSLVKQIDAKQFKKIMKDNSTSVISFTAPWCGHCQKMAPEFSKAAVGVHPFIPFYNVDCDDQKNKKLCAEQGVQGFPTIKLFPRGSQEKPKLFEHAQRSASAFYYFAARNIPHGVKKIYHLEDLPAWIEENVDRDRALLLNNGKGIPLLWQAIGNKYKEHFAFGIHRDRRGKSFQKMGFELENDGDSKVLIYPAGSKDFVVYEGIQKYDPLTKFFNSVVAGTADLKTVNEQAKQETYEPSEEELEIERQQEAQRMALAHGGFQDIAGFEAAVQEAVKSGHGADYHAQHGFGKPGSHSPKKEKEEDPTHKILKAQKEAEAESANSPKMAKTGGGGQAVFEAATESGHPRTADDESVTPGPASDTMPDTYTQEPVTAQETGSSKAAAAEETARPKDEL
ncbi:hypothetical protein NM688_g7692 [Phlebia brevispora]|uniref:Uncharacterized protein n=1 Tax=Phlebia brevispora TaxID=194682 RepID=A0ACC1S265_9APHY|nr:hypothetical protein NM688_g7692 [Phlebia brevispora]